MRLKILLLSIVIGVAFFGCSATKRDFDYSKRVGKEINLEYFIKGYNPSFSYKEQQKLVKLFKEYYFRPWRIDKFSASKKESMWQVGGFKNASYHGENKLLLSKEEKKELIDNSNFEMFESVKQKAITVVNTSLRLFPTNNPIYKVSEEFPFDFNQNSALKANKPVFISHFSKDKAWAYVQSPLAPGWIPVRDLAFVDDRFIDKYISGKLAVITKELTPIYDKNENFLFKAKVSTMFAIAKELENEFLVYFPQKDENLNATLSTIKISKNVIKSYPLKMDKNNIYIIANELLGEKYGWGGLFLKRDCSAMTRDFFMPFGVWLPRNSYSQSRYVSYSNIKELSIDEKESAIFKNAKPFESLIYLKGHIMLYLGEYQNRVYVMHNTWGLKSKTKCNDDDRKIYGRTLISNLYLGAEDESVYEDALLINRILGIANVEKTKLLNKN